MPVHCLLMLVVSLDRELRPAFSPNEASFRGQVIETRRDWERQPHLSTAGIENRNAKVQRKVGHVQSPRHGLEGY